MIVKSLIWEGEMPKRSSDKNLSKTTTRRQLLRNLALASGGVGVIGAGASGCADARGSGEGKISLDVDVAIYNDTISMIPAPGALPPVAGDGTTFIIEGEMFPGGTLTTGESIDTGLPVFQEARIGTWFCRGWFINTVLRPDPQIISHQDFFFGADLMTPNTIVTSGVEGNSNKELLFYRTVVGGTGEFSGVTGQTIYKSIGTNARLGDNLRYAFEMVAPININHRMPIEDA